MDEIEVIEGIDGLGATFGPSEFNYFPEDPTLKVRRFTRTKDGQPVFWLDYIIIGDTQYNVSIYAYPDFRDGKWVEYTNFDGVDKQAITALGYEKFGKAEKIIWLDAEDLPAFRSVLVKRDNLSKGGTLDDAEIYIKGKQRTGSPDRFHDTRNPLPADGQNN